MKPATRNAALGSVMAIGLLAGCGTGSYQTTEPYPPDPPPRVESPYTRSAVQYQDDAAISSRVQAAVLNVPGVHPQNLQISTYEGVVTLRGTTATHEAAHDAVDAARQVVGVRSVDYDLQLRSY